MGFDNDCILNIQSLTGEYFCAVCRLLVYPNEALQAPCTHLFCKPCLTYVVSTNHACPYDGYRVTEADSKPLLESNKALADTIGKIQVHCLYYRTGCTWQGALSECTAHCSTCAFGESPVLCNRCGIQLVHRQVQEHAQNCPGVHSQGQQPGVTQDSSTGAGSATAQSQPTAQTGASVSQGQVSQASGAPVSSQDTNQPANSVTQPQAAQAAVPTMEQWYQQQYQQQYQQYYQQYPGYDPYQQHYQYYYAYPQAGQQYQQQPMQAYAQAQPQVYGQAQPQSQLPVQPQAQSHVQVHPQQPPQAPSAAVQPQSQTQAQPAVNIQPQVQPVGQGQPQMHVQSQGHLSHTTPYIQSQSLPQAQPTQQPYAQPQPHLGPHQQMQPPQMQQPHPSHPQPYPQSQTQHYPYPQTQAQVQPPPQLNPQAPHPPSQPNQPIVPGAQPQAQNAVTGFQSYPQLQQQPQAQVGAAPQMQPTAVHQQSQYAGQMQGQFPSQASQLRPPQPYAAVPTQQPAMLSAQGQAPMGPPAQQLPVYPHAQQAGYAYPQRPGMQATQQAMPQQHVQQQSFPGQGPFMQAQLHAQGSSQIQPQSQQNYATPPGAHPNMAQNYAGRQMVPQGAVSQPYVQAAGAGQVRPAQLNQTYPMKANNQLPVAPEQPVNPQQSLKTVDGEKHLDQTSEKVKGHDVSMEARTVAGVSGVGSGVDETKRFRSETGLNEATVGNEGKRDVSLESASELPGSEHVRGTKSKLVGDDGQEGQRRLKENTAEGISASLSTGNVGAEDIKEADVQDLKHPMKGKVGASASASMLPQSHVAPQGHSSNTFPSNDQGRSQMQPMHSGPSAQPRPGVPSMAHAMPHPGTPQQPGLLGHPTNLRPQGPGQVLPGPPFHAVDNPPPSSLKHPPGASVPFDKPGDVGHYQGNVFPNAGHPHNPLGEPFVRPPFAAQQPGAFDSHGGLIGREPLPRSDVFEPRPPYPLESEKFPPPRPGYFDGRHPDSHPHVPVERAPHGIIPPVQPDASKFNGPSGHDSMHAPGMRDERFKPFSEEHFKSFPHREFEDDLRKYPRPSHLEAGSSKFGSQFPSSGPLDRGPHMFDADGPARPFDKGPRGFERDTGLNMDPGVGSGPSRFLPPFHPNDGGSDRATGFPDDNMGRTDFGRHPGPVPEPGFGRHHFDGLPSRSPGRDYTGFPPRTFGGYRDVDGNESRSFEGSKPYGFPAEPFGKSIHENRFPVPPNHLHMGELDIPGNFRTDDHLGAGHNNQDMPPSHFRRGEHMGPHGLHLRDGAAFGVSGGHPHMGERPVGENLPPHVPFGESFGGEKPRHHLVGEPGFRSSFAYQHHARDGGFYAGDLEPFDNSRKRKQGGIMCRICKVECGTVENLDLHSQSREHQRKAMDMVISIKQQNKKKQKTSTDRGSVGGGRDGSKPKTSSFEGRGNKR